SFPLTSHIPTHSLHYVHTTITTSPYTRSLPDALPISGCCRLRIRGSHPLWPAVPMPFSCPSQIPSCSPNPAMHASRFGLFRVRSPLLTESMFLSLPPGT